MSLVVFQLNTGTFLDLFPGMQNNVGQALKVLVCNDLSLLQGKPVLLYCYCFWLVMHDR